MLPSPSPYPHLPAFSLLTLSKLCVPPAFCSLISPFPPRCPFSSFLRLRGVSLLCILNMNFLLPPDMQRLASPSTEWRPHLLSHPYPHPRPVDGIGDPRCPLLSH